ncbi:hypothetical protein [Streptomyces sp. NPDC058755]|uniref:hypothetical protein n=1 Tax=Streptomyces sp. NPDC058755 TaxID=3346624 RepID=UPI0036BFFA73
MHTKRDRSMSTDMPRWRPPHEDLVVFLALLGSGVVLVCVGHLPVSALVGFAAGPVVLFEAWGRRNRRK